MIREGVGPAEDIGGRGKEVARMTTENEDRIEQLKDELLKPGLTESEINKIEKKLSLLQGTS